MNPKTNRLHGQTGGGAHACTLRWVGDTIGFGGHASIHFRILDGKAVCLALPDALTRLGSVDAYGRVASRLAFVRHLMWAI